MESTYMRSNKVKEKWDCEKFSFQGDPSCGLTWPPRNYNCTFCKREFRSAQALGGHMNVHRRDRARLRQLPSPVLEFQNPKIISNPNPSFPPSPLSSHSPPTKSLSFPYSPYQSSRSPYLTSFSSPSSASSNEQDKKRLLECHRQRDALSLRCGDMTKKKNMRADFGAGILKGCGQKCDELDVLKKEEVINLDLEMGLKDPKEVLDLELRLGYF